MANQQFVIIDPETRLVKYIDDRILTEEESKVIGKIPENVTDVYITELKENVN